MKIKMLKFLFAIFILMSICTACKQSVDTMSYFGNYDEVKKVSFKENYAYGPSTNFKTNINVEVTFTKEQLAYQISPVFIDSTEPIVYETAFDEQGWESLLEIMKKYELADWDIAGNYLYRNYSAGPSHHIKKENVEYVRQGDFFNLNSENFYLGIDQNELDFRCNYKGEMWTISEDEKRPFWVNGASMREYSSYGVPPNYNEFRQELWDFVIEHTGGYDWRTELDQIGRELMYQTFPYMTELNSNESIYKNIRYFNIMVSYGGKGAGQRVLFTYDGGSRTFNYLYPYVTRIATDIYSAVENGAKFSYFDTTVSYFDLTPIIDLVTKYMGLETIIDEDSSGLDDLLSLLEKYQVLEWEPKAGDTFYSGAVNEGDFFNIENLIDVEDENEKTFRSSCDVLINIICSDGTYREIRLQNGNMPQTYNQFHTEFWDLMLEYSYRNQLWRAYERYEKSGFSEAALSQNELPDTIELRRIKEIGWDEFLEQQDWRHDIDEEGYKYMVLKYPYMDSETENSE